MEKTISCEHGEITLEEPEKDDTLRRTFNICIQNRTSKGFMLLDWDWVEREVRTFFGKQHPELNINSVEIKVDARGPYERVTHD